MGEAGEADLAPGRGTGTPHPPFSVAPFAPMELFPLAQWPGCGEEAEQGLIPEQSNVGVWESGHHSQMQREGWRARGAFRG